MFLDNSLIRSALASLAKRLPRGWTIKQTEKGRQARKGGFSDAILKVSGPGSGQASIVIEAKSRIEPKDVDSLAASPRPDRDAALLVVAPFISVRTQERLEAAGFSYADLTGNIRLSLSKPALFIDARGADENPEPASRERRSLKGPKAGRLVRALCDFSPPVGLRELAKRAEVDAGYASRIVQVLVREALDHER